MYIHGLTILLKVKVSSKHTFNYNEKLNSNFCAISLAYKLSVRDL